MNATHHEYRGFVFTIAYQAQDPAYTVDFPDFPEIITSAATLPKGFDHACAALDLHLESLHKLKRKIPKPRHRLVLQTA